MARLFASTTTVSTAPLQGFEGPGNDQTTSTMTSMTTSTTSSTTSGTASGKTSSGTPEATGLQGPVTGHGGLGSGAIAGIAIGISLGVVIAVVLLFFMRRRNRASRKGTNASPPAHCGTGPYAGAVSDVGVGIESTHNNTGIDMPDKLPVEKDLGLNGTSPGSGPSSNGGPHSPIHESGAEAAAMPPSKHPITDIVVPAAPVRTSVDTPSSALEPSIVVALIGNNMTPEEMACLEEEERQLDADIAKANSKRAGSGSSPI